MNTYFFTLILIDIISVLILKDQFTVGTVAVRAK